jgi:hypothetical protein
LLQRQIAYDRLLERLYLVDDEWILKGAAALIARNIGVRSTIDIDVYRPEDPWIAEQRLREAAAVDIGDWFSFELGSSRPVTDGGGLRIPVTAYVGNTVWTTFHVDLVGSDMRMTGQPEAVPPIAMLAMPDLQQHGYRAYPLADHIADKVAAILERHGDREMPSTRFRDLVDLVAIITAAPIAADAQATALLSELRRRGLDKPDRFDVPDRVLWEKGYEAEALRSQLENQSLDEAVALVGLFVDPILSATAVGTWSPEQRGWIP